MSRSSPRFKLCKPETLPSFYFDSFNSSDNCHSTYCPFLSPYPLVILAVCVLLLLNSVQWSLVILPSARFHPLLTCLGVLSPFCTATRLSFPCLRVVTADWGSLRVLPWEPCVGKCHCFRQGRAWLRRDLRRSLGRHPLNIVSGPLRASVYCVLLKH